MSDSSVPNHKKNNGSNGRGGSTAGDAIAFNADPAGSYNNHWTQRFFEDQFNVHKAANGIVNSLRLAAKQDGSRPDNVGSNQESKVGHDLTELEREANRYSGARDRDGKGRDAFRHAAIEEALRTINKNPKLRAELGLPDKAQLTGARDGNLSFKGAGDPNMIDLNKNDPLEYTRGPNGGLLRAEQEKGKVAGVNAKELTSVRQGWEDNGVGQAQYNKYDTVDQKSKQLTKERTDYPGQNGRRVINGMEIKNIASEERQWNADKRQWDVTLNTRSDDPSKPSEPIRYSESEDGTKKFKPFDLTAPKEAGLLFPGNPDGEEKRNELYPGSFDGTMKDAYYNKDVNYKRTDTADGSRTLEFAYPGYQFGGGAGTYNVSIPVTGADGNVEAKQIDNLTAARYQFDEDRGVYKATYFDGGGKKYSATVDALAKRITDFEEIK